MSKLGERLRKVGLINNYDLLKRFGQSGDVAIEYHRPPDGRLGWTSFRHTKVWTLHRHPAMLQDGKPVAKLFRGSRGKSLPQAKAWAKAAFGHEYMPSPAGGYLPVHIVELAKTYLQARENEGAVL